MVLKPCRRQDMAMTTSWKQFEDEIVDGTFRLREYLGGDDSHAVFLTEYESRPAAIKLIPEDPRNGKRQLQQWRLVEKLSHPHLMRLFASGRHELPSPPMLYVVMEYAEENLAQVIPHRALTATEAREMLEPALGALAYVHSQGFVHGHLKPSNILAVDGRLRLSSDRLDRVGEQDSDKPDVYASPEMALEGFSPSGDVWSLGMILVEALTQQRPAREKADAGDPALPPSIPAPFLEIARNCLRRNPSSRWRVADVASRLRQNGAAPAGQKAERKPGTSHRLIYAISALLALILLAIEFGPGLLNRLRNPPVAVVQPEQPAVQPPTETAKQPPAEQKPPPPPTDTPKPQPTEEKTQPAEVKKPPAAAPVTPAPAPAVQPEATAPESDSGASAGKVVHRVMPDVLPKDRRGITGKVRVTVKVQVDASGKVVDAQLDSPGPSPYFAHKALQAARGWKFAATDGVGRRVWNLAFAFSKADTTVAVQTSP
jgi:TonB family protein